MTTDTWIANADGSWFTARDWSEKHAPSSGEDVVIDTASAYTITFNGAVATVNSLAVGNDGFDVASGTLTIAGAASFGGAVYVDGGTLAFDAGATTISDFSLIAGAVNIKAGTLSLDGPDVSLSGKIVGAGTLAIVGGATTIGSGAAITVAHLAVSGSGTTVDVDLSGAGQYAGAFSLGAGATVMLGTSKFLLSGAATATGGTIDGGGQLVTSGAVTISGLTIGGTVNWVASGKVTQSGGNVAIGDSSGATAALTIAAGGVYAIADDSDIILGAGASSMIYNLGLFGKTAQTGLTKVAVSVHSTGTLEDLVAGGGLELNGARNNISGTYIGPGMIDYGQGTVATLGDLNITQASCGTNLGTVDVTGVVTFHDGSTMVNDFGANWNLIGDVGLGLAAGSSDPSFTNYGAMAKLSGTGTSVVAIDANNAGSGVVTVYSGALAFDGPVNTLLGTITGKGEFELGGGGSTTIESGAKINSASFAVTGDDTLVTLDENLLYSGSFSLGVGAAVVSSADSLTLTGAATLEGGAVNGAIKLYTLGNTTASGFMVGGTSTWVNKGTVTQDGDDQLGDARGSIATLSNTSTGIYDIVGDDSISSDQPSSSFIANAGLFEKTGGLGLGGVYSNIQNTGEILATSGELLIQGALTGTGVDEVGAGATLAFGGAVAAGQTVEFTGAGGEIALQDLQASGTQIFHGVLGGFGTGDMIDIGAATLVGFTENSGGTSGVLTLHDGTASASITMLGDYSAANFALLLVGGHNVLTYQA